MLSPNTQLSDSNGVQWIVRQAVPGFDGSLYTAHRTDDPSTEYWLRYVPSRMFPAGHVFFERRASAICSYRNPAVPRGVAWGVDEQQGVRFLVMQAMPTTSLYSRMASDVSPEQITLWFEQIGRTLSQLHHQGLPHCDLHLKRVGLDDDGLVMLGPWGFPLPYDPSTIPSNTPLPTSPSTLAPEALIGPDAAPRASDVYGFGQMLYEALTDKPGFEGNDLAALAAAKTNLGKLDPGLRAPEPLRTVVLQATSADPHERPDIDQLLQSLHPAGAEPNEIETDWIPMVVRRSPRATPTPAAPRGAAKPSAPIAPAVKAQPRPSPQPSGVGDLSSAVLYEQVPPPPAASAPSTSDNNRRTWIIAAAVLILLCGGGSLAFIAALTVTWLYLL